MDIEQRSFAPSRRGFVRNFAMALTGLVASPRSASAQQAAAPRTPQPGPDRSGAINVKDFGAVCDGAADDYAAFNAAVNRVAALAVGGTLIIPGPMKIGTNI